MTEITKTALFFALALGAIALAVLTRPSTSDFDVDEMRGQMLFNDAAFEGDKAKRLRITSVNEESGEQRVFEVTESDGVWTIPSKSNYPADATQQMGEAVEGLSGKEILTVESTDSGSHAQFGVVDPTDKSATSGYGKRVQLFDEKDKPLADLIIGKKDKDGNYYVRRGGQDQVFLVKLDEESFSTDFRDWIEKDLLQFSPFDVSEVAIDDYTFNLVNTREGPQFSLDRRAKLALEFDDKTNEWSPRELLQYDRRAREYKPFELAAHEQLNDEALRELKNALDDLVIVDVERKPEGLSADLQAGKEFMTNTEAVESLYKRGFTPVEISEGQVGLLSSEGEIVVTLKTGVEYVLRFGDLQLDLMGDGAERKKEDEEGAEDAEGVNRFLFVMARFNEGVIEKPELEPLPELPAEEATEDASAAGEGEEEAATEGTETEEAGAETADTEEGATEEGATEEGNDAEGEADKARAEIEQQRKVVEEANKKREKDYQKKLEEGRKKVEELNARFGDWYYVIPNDVFKKIHLGREQLITEKKEDANPDADKPASPGIGLPDFGLGSDEEGEGEPAPETPEGEAAEEGAGEESAPSSPTTEGEEVGEPTENPAAEEAASEATEPTPPAEPATEEPAPEAA